MSTSFSVTETQTFTVTHARRMASKIAADLRRMNQFYGYPNLGDIEDYETEAIALLKAGYLDTVWYGFKRDGEWIEPTLKYSARDLEGFSANDDDPGKIKPRRDVSRASFYSFLDYTSAWFNLSTDERQAFKQSLPFLRTGGELPKVNGYLESDRTYSSGGRALDRSSVRSF